MEVIAIILVWVLGIYLFAKVIEKKIELVPVIIWVGIILAILLALSG